MTALSDDYDYWRETREFFRGLEQEDRELDAEEAYNRRVEGKGPESSLDSRELR